MVVLSKTTIKPASNAKVIMTKGRANCVACLIVTAATPQKNAVPKPNAYPNVRSFFVIIVLRPSFNSRYRPPTMDTVPATAIMVVVSLKNRRARIRQTEDMSEGQRFPGRLRYISSLDKEKGCQVRNARCQ